MHAFLRQQTKVLLTRDVPLSQALHVLDLDEEGGGRSRMDERTGPGGRGGGYAGYRGPGLVTPPTSQARILQVVRGCVCVGDLKLCAKVREDTSQSLYY